MGARGTLYRYAVALTAIAMVLAACGDAESEGETADDAAEEASSDASDEESEAVDTDDGDGAQEASGDDDQPYPHDQIQLLMPVGPGGGVDATGSFIAAHLGRHIPGNPTIVPTYEPGGGTIVGANLFQHQYPTDGSVIFLSTTSTYVHKAAQNEQVDYDYNTWLPLAGDCGQAFTVVRSETGFTGENFEELPNLDGLVMGHTGHTSAYGFTMLAYHALGIPIEAIGGYEGTAELQVAYEQGEINTYEAVARNWPEMQEWIAEGHTKALFSVPQVEPDGSLVRDPLAPDVPHIGELYELIHGEEPAGEVWEALNDLRIISYQLQNVFWMHPDVDAELVDVISQAFASLSEDSEFVAANEENQLLCGDTLMVDSELERSISEMHDVDPASFDLWLEVLREEFGYEG